MLPLSTKKVVLRQSVVYCRVVWTPPRPPPTSAALQLGYDNTPGAYPGLSWARKCLQKIILRFVLHFSNDLSNILYQNASQPSCILFTQTTSTAVWGVSVNQLSTTRSEHSVAVQRQYPSSWSERMQRMPSTVSTIAAAAVTCYWSLDFSLKSHPYIDNARGVSFNLCASVFDVDRPLSWRRYTGWLWPGMYPLCSMAPTRLPLPRQVLVTTIISELHHIWPPCCAHTFWPRNMKKTR